MHSETRTGNAPAGRRCCGNKGRMGVSPFAERNPSFLGDCASRLCACFANFRLYFEGNSGGFKWCALEFRAEYKSGDAYVFGVSALSQANDYFFARERESFFQRFFYMRKKWWFFSIFFWCVLCFWGGVFFVTVLLGRFFFNSVSRASAIFLLLFFFLGVARIVFCAKPSKVGDLRSA